MNQERSAVVPLGLYIDRVLRSYRRGLPAVVALGFVLLFGGTVFFSKMNTDRQLLKAISAHVASLIETEDRPELQRLVRSIAIEKRSAILVVEDGIVLASSRSLSELDQPYHGLSALTISPEAGISRDGLTTKIPAVRPGGPKDMHAEVIMISSLSSTLFGVAAIALFVLILGLYVGDLVGREIRKAVGVALQPVQDLDEAIRALESLKDPDVLQPSEIMELESIRLAIRETYLALVNARDALAERKAKALAAEAYQRLIHDLHNPIAALGSLIKVVHADSANGNATREGSQRMLAIAEQILSQIDAAKANIDIEAEILREGDIRSCVDDAAEQSRLGSANGEKIILEKLFPEEPVLAPHDDRLLRRAVGNLVKNAMEACEGRVRVVVRALAKEISIQVMDDGPGMSQDQAGLYLQGRKRSTKGDRQAFGLAAANHIVRSHGGRIIYRPSDLGGACFEIRI
jgi:signal transduction histidine kinase